MLDINVRGVFKAYRLPIERGGAMRIASILKRKQTFFALKNVSFDVGAGEALGIVGPNGSGKTTLIKLLSSITAPTRGEIVMRGRLASLVEVGAGFHPDLTGRENIYLNGSILGMNHREITRKIDDIVEFSGLGAFLNVPVKRYSSGMFVRLGFSIAAHLDAEILLLDEVLAFGDVAFQTRCLDRIDQVRKDGRTIVLVSHDLAAIERICDRALLLRAGEIVEMGDPKTVIEAHQTLAYSSLPQGSPTGSSAGPVTLKEVTFVCPDGGQARTGAPLICRLAYDASELVSNVSCTLSFIWPSGYLCTQLTSGQVQLHPGLGQLEFKIPTLMMQRGLYSVDVAIEHLGGRILDQRSRCSLLRVDPGRIVAGDFYMPHTCLVQPNAA